MGPRSEPHSFGTSMVDSAHSICSVRTNSNVHKLLLLSEFSHSLFFNILHPPLNVPALGKLPSRAVETLINHCVAVSLNEDVDTNKELVAHGYSNILAGVFGTVYVALVAVYMID